MKNSDLIYDDLEFYLIHPKNKVVIYLIPQTKPDPLSFKAQMVYIFQKRFRLSRNV